MMSEQTKLQLVSRAESLIKDMKKSKNTTKKKGDTDDLSDKTKDGYVRRIKNMVERNIDIFGDEQLIIDMMCYSKDLPPNPNQTPVSWDHFHDGLSATFRVREAEGLSVDLIGEVKDDREYYEDNCKNKKEVVEKPLPKLEDIYKYVNSLYAAEEWQKYVINYIIVNLNTRNQDVDLIITTSKPTDTDDNYLYIHEGGVTYIRNKYKTVLSYGQKVNEITDVSFKQACKKLLGEKGREYLLLNSKNGERIKKVTLDKYVRLKTYQEVGEAMIFKVIATAATKKQLKQLALNRGTDLETIDNYYDKSE